MGSRSRRVLVIWVSGIETVISQLAVLICDVLSLVTLVFFPAPGGCLQAVDLWDFAMWYYYFFVCRFYFSRGKGNNSLKSKQM